MFQILFDIVNVQHHMYSHLDNNEDDHLIFIILFTDMQLQRLQDMVQKRMLTTKKIKLGVNFFCREGCEEENEGCDADYVSLHWYVPPPPSKSLQSLRTK